VSTRRDGHRPRRRPWRAATGALATLTFLAAATTGCGTGSATKSSNKSPGPSASATATGASLSTSMETSAGSWAVFPMGRLGQPLNTFWQLFFRPSGGSRWSDKASALAVATNGGLVIATPDSHSVAVGIRSTDALSFSPLLVTLDAGRSWSPAAPVVALAAEPDALAVDPGGRALALATNGSGGEVLASSAGLASWSQVTTTSGLGASSAGRACGLASMTAVGWVAGHSVIGGDCRRAGVVGIFTGPQGGWHLAGPTLPVSLADGSIGVLGLQRTTSGLCALLAVSAARGTSLVAAWVTAGSGTWSVSPALQIGSKRVLSFGPDGRMGLFVLSSGSTPSRSTSFDSVEVLSGAGAAWRGLPTAPAHTATMVFGAAGRVDALVVEDTVFTDWGLAPATGRWTREQVMNVPIQFGSSS